MFCLLTSMKYQINRGHVMFCLLTLMKIIPNLSVITNKFGPNTARVCMGYPWKHVIFTCEDISFARKVT